MAPNMGKPAVMDTAMLRALLDNSTNGSQLRGAQMKKTMNKAAKSYSKGSFSSPNNSTTILHRASSVATTPTSTSRGKLHRKPSFGSSNKGRQLRSTLSLADIVTGSSTASWNGAPNVAAPSAPTGPSPHSVLLQKLQTSTSSVRSVPSLQIPNVFKSVTPEQIKAYDKEAVMAINKRDIDKLRTWHHGGRAIDAANQFGESLLHLSCRRGHLDVVKFMVQEAGVQLTMLDDMGRTPLHYACWTTEPNFALLDFLVEQDCDLLLVADKRGHAPLDYTRKDHWGQWTEYVKQKNVQELLPKRPEFCAAASPVLSPVVE